MIGEGKQPDVVHYIHTGHCQCQKKEIYSKPRRRCSCKDGVVHGPARSVSKSCTPNLFNWRGVEPIQISSNPSGYRFASLGPNILFQTVRPISDSRHKKGRVSRRKSVNVLHSIASASERTARPKGSWQVKTLADRCAATTLALL